MNSSPDFRALDWLGILGTFFLLTLMFLFPFIFALPYSRVMENLGVSVSLPWLTRLFMTPWLLPVATLPLLGMLGTACWPTVPLTTRGRRRLIMTIMGLGGVTLTVAGVALWMPFFCLHSHIAGG